MIRFILIFGLAAGPAAASDVVQEALRAVEGIDNAKISLQLAEEAEDQVVALTAVVKAFETGMAVLRDAGRRAQLAKDIADQEFTRDSQEVSRLLAAMQAAGGPTTATRLLHPSGPIGSARAAMLMAEVVPDLQGAAAQTADRLAEIAALETAILQATDALATGSESAQSARLALAGALRNRGSDVSEQSAVQSALADAARSLQDLALIMAETPAQQDLISEPTFQSRLGGLTPPVDGVVLGAVSGDESDGIFIATRPNALVTTPVSATVRYQGTLTGYGNVIILEPGPGYLLILTGVHEVLVSAGQVLPPDAAIGLMGTTQENHGGSQFDPSNSLSETLYVEARANGDTVDPATWFALDKEN